LLLWLLGAGSALAQDGTGSIAGVVTDGATGRPIAGVVVVVTSPATPTPRAVVTDAGGTFTFEGLPASRYQVGTSLEGYKPETRDDLVLADGVTLRAALAIIPDAVQLEEIVVTGSRIHRKDLSTPAPVTVITREELINSGKLTIGDYLQALPEQANAPNASWNNLGDGSIRASLRGLGEWRTLVLLNGRRFVAGGSGANDSVDLGSIPSAAVERIEVLKDGASPIYGSDAIAGVINVITRKGWLGTEVTSYAGTSARNDGTSYDVNFTTGQGTERGSLLFSAGYSTTKPIWSGSRPWSSYAWNYDATGTNSPNGVIGPYAVGSSMVPSGRAFTVSGRGVPVDNPGNDPKIALYNWLVTTYPGAGSFVPDPAAPNGWRPWAGPALPLYKGDQYNYQPDNYLVTPSSRLSLFSTGEAKLGERARGFYEASYVSRHSRQALAPEPLDLAGDGVVLSASNQFNPFGIDLIDVYGRLMSLGNRTFTQDIDTLRLVVGLDGRLPASFGPLRDWSWEGSLAIGRTQGTELKQGYTRISALRAALGPSHNFGTTANPDWGCGPGPGPEDRIVGCTPMNIFGPSAGPASSAERAFLTYDGVARGTNQLTSLQLNTTGELFRLLGPRPASLAAGYEYRKVSGTYIPDAISAIGDASTDGRTDQTRGSQDVHEAFAELSLPVVEGLPLAEVLEFQLAARTFRYSGFGADWLWKVGGRWKPIQDVTVRGTYSTAYRAPSIFELYYGARSGNGDVSDPCAGIDELGNPRAVSPWCGAAAGNGLQPQLAARENHGNPALRPELAHIFTAGLVLEPRFVSGLSVAVDVYGVAIDQVIQSSGDPVAACYPISPDQPPRFCENVRRDPITQAITWLLWTPVNYGTEKMAGLDLSARYALPTGLGRFGFSADATWLHHYDLVQADGSVLHVKGNYDLGAMGAAGIYPAWKFNAGASWKWQGLSAGADVRYIGSLRECADVNGNFPGAFCSFDHAYERRISPSAAVDARVGYSLQSSAGKTDLLVGVRNLFDTSPPRVYASWFPSDPGYDFIGRYVYVRVAHRL
jgi:outer membrane receptor protein involved in Fe transport